MADNGNLGELSRAQHRAVAALVTARTVADAAQTARVGERTLHRWLADDLAFRRALSRAQGAAIGRAVARLAQLASLAVDALEAVLTDEEASQATRTRAADLVLSHLVKLAEWQGIEERLSALEVAYGEKH